MAGILVYALHYEGAINKNSLGAVSEGARLASEIGGECHAIVVGGDDLTDDLAASVGEYGATKVYRANAPEGLAQPVVDAMAKVIADNGHGYALFGGGLLGFEVGAGLAARPGAGVAMEVADVLVAAAAAWASRRGSSSSRSWPRPSAATAQWRPRAPWSTRAGTPTPPRSGRRARPSRPSSTWRPASPARSSTR